MPDYAKLIQAIFQACFLRHYSFELGLVACLIWRTCDEIYSYSPADSQFVSWLPHQMICLQIRSWSVWANKLCAQSGFGRVQSHTAKLQVEAN